MAIYAKVISDSIGSHGGRILSIVTKAPMFLDAEFEKHRRLSNVSSNSSSNRAIPFLKMIDMMRIAKHDERIFQYGKRWSNERNSMK